MVGVEWKMKGEWKDKDEGLQDWRILDGVL